MLILSERERDKERERERERELHVLEEKKESAWRGGRLQSGFWETDKCVITRKDKEATLVRRKYMKSKTQTELWCTDGKSRCSVSLVLMQMKEKSVRNAYVLTGNSVNREISLQWFASWSEEMRCVEKP